MNEKNVRLPSLDGWRALSIIMVLGSHCLYSTGFPEKWKIPFTWLFDGGLGVRFFFVISGFLITWLMMNEGELTGVVNLKSFYIRRAVRILPVYYLFLLTIALLQLFTPFHQSFIAWVGNLTFTSNFIDAGFTTGHLWSLATEEQFYLLWPILFASYHLHSNPKLALGILALAIAVAPFSRVAGYTAHPVFLYPITRHFSFFSFFDSLAMGCAAAILYRKYSHLTNVLISKRYAVLLIGLCLILLPYILMRFRAPRYLMVPFGPSFQAFGFSILLLQSINLPEWGFYPALNWNIAVWIGVLSYSIYIWQEIFCTPSETFGFGGVWWFSFPGWLISAFAVACLSYYALERPLLGLRSRFRKV